MHRSTSLNTPPYTPPPTSSNLPVTHRSITAIPPSIPYLHFLDSGVLTHIDTRPTSPTFIVINNPLHLRETFVIGDIVVFQLPNQRLGKNIIFQFPKRRVTNPLLIGVITNIDNNKYTLEDNEGTQFIRQQHCIRKYNSLHHNTLLEYLPNHDTFGYRINKLRINSSVSYASSRNRMQEKQP